MIGVTGYKGRLGSELIKQGCVGFEGNINDEYIGKYINKFDVLIHCAAITDVDGCERDLYDKAFTVNEAGTKNLRRNFNGKIIYLSTDYVFDGMAKGNYGEHSIPNPISVYGYTKLLGEGQIKYRNHPGDVIVRTTILYGSPVKPDFVTNTLAKLRSGEKFTVPYNLFGNPTYVPHLAEALMKLVEIPNPPRIVNIAGKEILSRYEFVLAIADTWGLDKSLIVPVREVPGAAMRPLKVGLKTVLAEKLGLPIYSVYDGLKEMKETYG